MNQKNEESSLVKSGEFHLKQEAKRIAVLKASKTTMGKPSPRANGYQGDFACAVGIIRNL